MGVPLDKPIEQLVQPVPELERLMDQYGVEPELLPEGLTDITPYYWRDSSTAMSTYALEHDPGLGLAVVHIMPKQIGTVVVESSIGQKGASFIATERRSVRLPNDTTAKMIVGGSPRWPGKLCLHELIVYKEDEL
jgi:hypothetical protein